MRPGPAEVVKGVLPVVEALSGASGDGSEGSLEDHVG